MVGKILNILQLLFFLFFRWKQVTTLSKKINQDIFEFYFQIELNKYYFIILNKNYPVLPNQELINLILLIISHLYSYFIMLPITDYYLLSIYYSPNISFETKLMFKSILFFYPNLNLL